MRLYRGRIECESGKAPVWVEETCHVLTENTGTVMALAIDVNLGIIVSGTLRKKGEVERAKYEKRRIEKERNCR